jgi:hypothetical protein
MTRVTGCDQIDPRRLRLGPATRLLWRSATAVHLELGSRAVVLEGMPPRTVSMIASRSAPADAARAEVDAEQRAALEALHAAGYLWTRCSEPPETGDPRLLPPTPRLARELTALTSLHGDAAGAVLRSRRAATVLVSGSNAVAVHLAALLAAAGVGRVWCAISGTARLLHAMPGGVQPNEEGMELAAAAADAIGRAAPQVNNLPLPPGEQPDLVVLAADAPIDEDRRAALHASHTAHLAVTVGADHGAVGPLVLPGLTSCLRCADLHRRDRDPAWPALAAQLAVPPVRGGAVEVAMATLLVGTAALQALSYLDGGEPACIDASLELQLPDWRLRRRTRPVHPECDCAAPS